MSKKEAPKVVRWDLSVQQQKARDLLATPVQAPTTAIDLNKFLPHGLSDIPSDPVDVGETIYRAPGEVPGREIIDLEIEKLQKGHRRLREEERRKRLLREPYVPIVEVSKRRKPEEFLTSFQKLVNFREHGDQMEMTHDPIQYQVTEKNGDVKDYDTQRKLAEEKTQKKEAASYGIGNINGKEFVLYATHFDYMGGSIGVIAGQKLVLAAELAAKEKIPFVVINSTGGIRQWESMLGLWQMPEVVRAISHFQETKQPYISIANRCYGGPSASSLPLGISGAIRGSDVGFSGKAVIEAFTRTPMPEGAQSAEAHVFYRNLQVLWNDEHELYDWLDRLFHVTMADKKKKKEQDPKYNTRLTSLPLHERFPFGGMQYYSPVTKAENVNPDIAQQNWQDFFAKNEPKIEDRVLSLYERFRALRDARRPDAEMLMRMMFDEVVPLYSNFVADRFIWKPQIATSVVLIHDKRFGDRKYVVIANLASYQQGTENIYMIPSTPEPKDYKEIERAYQLAEQLGYPVVAIVNTPGAMPTNEAEREGIYREIAKATKIAEEFKGDIFTYIIGEYASGGAIGTGPVRRVAMLQDALAYVAEPRSSTAIMKKTPNPSIKDIIMTLSSMKPTAKDMKDLELIEGIIAVPQAGAIADPFKVAERMREDLLLAEYYRHGVHPRKKLRDYYAKMKRQWRQYIEHHP